MTELEGITSTQAQKLKDALTKNIFPRANVCHWSTCKNPPEGKSGIDMGDGKTRPLCMGHLAMMLGMVTQASLDASDQRITWPAAWPDVQP